VIAATAHRIPTALCPLARLFVVKSSKGARFFVRMRPGAPDMGVDPPGKLFHGEVSGAWVHRLRSEGGGYCVGAAVEEVR